MIDRKALHKLVEVPQPRDDEDELVQVTKKDLRYLLSSCELCAFVFGMLTCAAVILILAVVLEHFK